ncbi:flagellar hook-associated protein FlgL [Pseudovibrio sp. W64]|uniref:flagellin N-terminal helical domain-containing protein n=1 Tax=unclassified Pseudovibrio TaxID=2627060 RepID=UPI0007AE6849|nr:MULTISPECIES: flagellin [unclassified Pseudovibrio]KZK81893.1 flagellar hook-associated protein FlgL [Pseudovibrio sp. W64]
MVYSVSTLSSSLRLTDYLIEHRAQLDKAVIENASKKHADFGLTLGAQTGMATSFRSEYSQMVSQLNTNKQVITRFEVMDTALDNVEKSATDFRSNLVALQKDAGTLKTASELAYTELGKLTNALNSNVGGVYVFGGINTGTPPVRDFDYVSPTPSAADPAGPEQAIEQAFFAVTGLTIGTDTALIEALPDASWEAFLDSPEFNSIFDASWSPTWTSATTEKMLTTISPGVTTDGSGTANSKAFSELAKGYAMVAVFGKFDIGEGAQELIFDRAINHLNVGVGKTIDVSATNGAIKANVTRTNTDIEAKRDVLNARIIDLENVDENRAAVELSQAQTQLEATYSITAKIKDLNIMRYL